MRYSITSYFVVLVYFASVTRSAPSITKIPVRNRGLCESFLDWIKTGAQCDLTGAFTSTSKTNIGRATGSKNVVPPKPLIASTSSINKPNINRILENNEPHMPADVNNLQPLPDDELPIPVVELNNRMNQPVPANAQVNPVNELPDFDVLLPQEGINVASAGSSIGGSIIGTIGSISI
ncbi:hypothetical protein BB561_006053 [Smittium simulii]|uniref:Uncharacterized protein n=1 Tax=Smittium simulii TaxID=133385 RepID=A0A2T9Y6S3_9FUNG|nr:hypothetical protein BB561_006053 [Smittium simulii]